MKKYILILFLLLPISMLAHHWETIPTIKDTIRNNFGTRMLFDIETPLFFDKDTVLFQANYLHEFPDNNCDLFAYYYDKKFHLVPLKNIYSKYISDSDFINRISDKKIKILNIKKDNNVNKIEFAMTLGEYNIGNELHFRSGDKYKTINKIYLPDSSKYYNFIANIATNIEYSSSGKPYFYLAYAGPYLYRYYLLCTIEADTIKVIRRDHYDNLLPIKKILKIDKKDNLWLSNGKYLSYYDTKTDTLIKEFHIKEIYNYGNGHATLPANLHITDDNNLILVDARMRILYYNHEKWTLDDYAYRCIEQQQRVKNSLLLLNEVNTVIDKYGNIYMKPKSNSPFMFVKYVSGKWEEIYFNNNIVTLTIIPLFSEDYDFGFFTKDHSVGVYSIFIPKD